ncbi:hypothetical protein [Parasulfuritortus cantonensis]|uniref:hypothetical protein n=1 Tax=Parasulfuritortus cantonensis TaxID=2528202 RepID=UPI0014049B9C|nr:hypothetical protein [Parasulfuritortus cantonensis]
MESMFYEVKPYLLLGVGGSQMFYEASVIGLMCAFVLGALGGLILGMRLTARRRVRRYS